MKKLKSKLLALMLSATMVVGSVVGMSACDNGSSNSTDDKPNVDAQIYAVYTAYQENGGTLSYDEWYAQLLASAKGDKGDPGEDGVGIKSVTLNENGELVLEFTDGNKKNLGEVVGEAGKNGVGIESLEIDEDGNLVVTLTDDTTETLGKVVGENGSNGTNGENGKGITKAEYKEGKLVVTYTDGTSDEIDLEIPQPHVHTWSDWSTVEEATCSSVGISKRTCEDESCDSEEYKLEKQLAHTYGDTPTAVVPATCTEGGVKIYVCSECGNVKGEATEPNGHQYDESGTCTVCGADKSVKKNYGKVSIAAGENYTLNLSGIENGMYAIVAKTDGEAEKDTLIVTSIHTTGSTSGYTYDMYMPVSKTYQSILFIKDGAETASVKNNSSDTVEAEISIVEYKLPTIKLGEEIEVPCMNTNEGYVDIPLDETIIADGSTQYKVTILYAGKVVSLRDQAHSSAGSLASSTGGDLIKELSWKAGTSSLAFTNSGSSGTATNGLNISVKFESV